MIRTTPAVTPTYRTIRFRAACARSSFSPEKYIPAGFPSGPRSGLYVTKYGVPTMSACSR